MQFGPFCRLVQSYLNNVDKTQREIKISENWPAYHFNNSFQQLFCYRYTWVTRFTTECVQGNHQMVHCTAPHCRLMAFVFVSFYFLKPQYFVDVIQHQTFKIIIICIQFFSAACLFIHPTILAFYPVFFLSVLLPVLQHWTNHIPTHHKAKLFTETTTCKPSCPLFHPAPILSSTVCEASHLIDLWHFHRNLK